MEQWLLPTSQDCESAAVEIGHAATNNGEYLRSRPIWGPRTQTNHGTSGPGWTDERVDLLKKLWADGLSCSQIATKLGEITRNAVIGKVHRLGLAGRDVIKRAAVPRTRRAVIRRLVTKAVKNHAARMAAPKPAPILIPVLDDTAPGTAKLIDLTSTMCHWPIGDPMEPGFHFCGRRKRFGTPYCEHHTAIATQPATKRRKGIFQLANVGGAQ